LNQLLEPSEFEPGVITRYIDIPRSWNKYITNKESNTGYGYATYMLTFITEENGRLALMIPRVRTAYKLWVNGELNASAGTVGQTRDTMIPQYLEILRILLSDYNDGRRKTFYCVAINLLPLQDIEKIMSQTANNTLLNKLTIKEKADYVVSLFQSLGACT